MKTKLSFFMLLLSIAMYSQLAGKKIKTPITAIDNHVYSIGDSLSIGFPSKGEIFQYVGIYKFESGFSTATKVIGVLAGDKVEKNEIVLAKKDLSKLKAKIIHFQDIKNTLFASLEYKDGYRILIQLNEALKSREIISNSKEYNDKFLENTTADINSDKTIIKSFNSDYKLQLVSCIGNKNDQTVTVNLLVSHKLPHQSISFGHYVGDGNNLVYDFSGNFYPLKSVKFGSSSQLGIYNGKLPTNVPINISLTYKQILPEVKELSFLTSNFSFGAFDDYHKENGVLEISNLKIDWK
ncbi:hypothetical protein Q361_1045 [Flavobacterium croceum DSM 17960]|uniref:Uncharacterized protein n=1 Tax=Flavobacterium croceum DSM 17960 TaxID=1121886 RepID=A0A2S4N9B6_9FLAO|nr:hypothetical protein [Flavobacterium croceum]POS02286.1 hypothetical protein Q361_1045 [Flavobacterium croceum DSM 17960]